MMTEKTKVKREAVKPMKKKRKLSEETKEKLRVRLAEMRAKKKPAEYKNVAKSVLDLPDDDKYSFKNVKEWIKQSKLNVSTLTKTARGFRTPPQQKQQAANAAEHKKAYTFSLDNTSIEFVTFRLTGYSFSPKPEIKELSNNNNINDAFLEKRKVNYGEEGEFLTNVYIRDKLPKNVEILGPCVIEEDSTVSVVLPGQKLNVDDFGFLRIK